MTTGWGKIKEVAKYSDMSERTCRDWLKCGLRHVRLPSGTILIKFEWIDQFLAQFETSADEVAHITDEVLKDF